MSEILQKTFKVLLGSGEGVGWSSPTPSSPHSLSSPLANTLKHLALVTPKEEGELFRRQLDQCSTILNNPESTGSNITECIVRVMFLNLMGHDVSTLHIHAVKLAQASNLLHRKLGYLACSLLLPPHSELRIMVTNSIVKDLSHKSSVPNILTGLIATCNIINDPSVLSLFIPRVQKLVKHTNYLIRTKALIALERFCDISGGLWPELEPSVISGLSDQDPGVVSTAIQILARKLVANGPSCELVVGPLMHVYKQIHEGRFPRDFMYKGLAAPWTQVHIMRTLTKMNIIINQDNRIKVSVTELYQNILGLEFSKENMVQVLISEAIVAVSKLDCLKPFTTLSIKKISKFLQSKNNQVKYCGLDLLQQIFKSNPPDLNGTQEDNVIFCLEHTDLSIQLKTFNLLITFVNKENCEKIINSLLVYIKKISTQNEEKRLEAVEEHVPRIYEVITKYSDSLDWTVESLLRLIQCTRGKVQRHLTESLKMTLSSKQDNFRKPSVDLSATFQSIDLASDCGDNSEIVKVQTKFCQLMQKLVESGVKNPVIIELYIWQLGYFTNTRNADDSKESIMITASNLSPDKQLLVKKEDLDKNENIICQACWALLDIRLKSGINNFESVQFLTNMSKSKNLRIKHESRQVLNIFKNLDVGVVKEVTEEKTGFVESVEVTDELVEGSEETDSVEVAQETLEVENFSDIDSEVSKSKGEILILPEIENMDFTLSFLDQIVYANLCQGGDAYVPLSLRTASRTTRTVGDMNSSAEKPLITSTYNRSRKDTANSARSSVTPPLSSPCLPPSTPKLWTTEGRVEETEIVQELAEKEEKTEIEPSFLETSADETNSGATLKDDILLEGW